MKLTLIQVSTLDGITTQGGSEDHHSWTSDEDQKIFYKELDNARLVIMGSTTYNQVKKFMQHKEGRVRIVMTSNPSKYTSEAIPGKLEFANNDPVSLLQRLESEGITEGLLVGGATTNTKFLKERLVTHLIQTVEPKIVGTGKGTAVENIDINLQLTSLEKLNDRGTLLLKYEVLY